MATGNQSQSVEHDETYFRNVNILMKAVLQWHHEGGNFFSEYERSNWLFYVGYYLEVSSSLLYGQELTHEGRNIKVSWLYFNIA